jgi:hypothetical protein
MGGYPSPPWRLSGRVAVVPSPWTGALLFLGLYDQRSTLPYGEAVGMVGPVVRLMYVDDRRSIAGGREIWALPKEPMTLRWRGGQRTEVEAHDAAGVALLSARWTPPRIRLPLPAILPFLGTLGGAQRLACLAGGVLVGFARIDVDVPEDSAFAALGVTGRRLGLAGRLDVMATHPLLGR